MLAAYVFIYGMWILQTTAEFINIQTTEQWQLYRSHGDQDCSDDGKYRRFPELYRMNSNVTENDPDIGPPVNYTVAYFEKTRELSNYYYPGMNVGFYPPDTGADRIKGYELEITMRHTVFCFVYVMNQMPMELETNKMSMEFFPLHNLKRYWLTVTSLPVYNSSQSAGPIQLVSNTYYYRDPGASKEPADWVAQISHYITKSNDSRSLHIVFSRPPPEYGFQRYQIALIPVGDYIQVQSEITTQFYHDFLEVEPGLYKISINALDDFFSQSERCLCHNDTMCTNCLSTQTNTFTVD